MLAEHDVTARHGAVWNLLVCHGLTVKKKTAHVSEQQRADVVAARKTWRHLQKGLESFKLVFIDESGVKTNMARRLGRAKKGKRLAGLSGISCVGHLLNNFIRRS